MESTKPLSTYVQTHSIGSSDPDLMGMAERLKEHQQAVYAINLDKEGMLLMMRLLCKNCTPQEIAQFLRSADSFFGIGVKSLEECFPADSPVVNFIKQIGYAHLTSSSFSDNVHYLTGECAKALHTICSVGYTESEDKTLKKIPFLMQSILGTEGGSQSSRLDLSKLNLSGLDFTGMDLTDADLSNTNLSRTNLSGVKFCNADLSNTDFSFVENWFIVNFLGVKSMEGAKATCPGLQQVIDCINGEDWEIFNLVSSGLELMQVFLDAIGNITVGRHDKLSADVGRVLRNADLSPSNIKLIPDLVEALNAIETSSGKAQISHLVETLNKIERSSIIWLRLEIIDYLKER